MRGADKKYVPEVKLFFSKEFFPSYGGFSKTLNDKLSLFTSQTSSYEKVMLGGMFLLYKHYLFYYCGANINTGINITHHFKIFNGFYLNISIGYSYREIKYKDIFELVNNISENIEDIVFMFNLLCKLCSYKTKKKCNRNFQVS